MLSWNKFTVQNNYRVLVVDDSGDIHDDFRKILNPTNIERNEKTNKIYNKLLSSKASNETNENNASVLPEYEIDSAYQGMEGIQLVHKSLSENNPYAIAFVDIRMPPGLDGIETIKQIWEKDEEIQIVICTAYSDYSWIEMIKHLGKSDRLVILKKPFDETEIIQITCALTTKWALQRKVSQTYADDILTAYRVLQNDYECTKQLLFSIVDLHQNYSKGHCREISKLASSMGAALNLPVEDLNTLAMAGMLYSLGKIGLPEEIQIKAITQLNKEEVQEFEKYPVLGATILSAYKPFKDVVDVILNHRENFDGTGFPHKLKGDAIPLNARILSIAVDYYELQEGLHYPVKMVSKQASHIISNERYHLYDPKIIKSFIELITKQEETASSIGEAILNIKQLLPGMVLSRDLFSQYGLKLLARDSVLSEEMIETLQMYKDYQFLNVYIKEDKKNEQ